MSETQELLPSALADPEPPGHTAERKRVPKPPADVAPGEIEHALKRGAIWTLASQLAIQSLRFAGVIVLARLLTPSDYGAAALSITIASFSVILGDLGYGTALVQASVVSRRWASTACWSALGAGIIGTGVVALGAVPAAQALGEPQVTGLVIVGGLTLLITAAGSTSTALLSRSMRFSAIQGAGLMGSVVGTLCGITIAILGGGAWALVLQQVVLAAVTTALVIVTARWRPSLEFSREALRSLSKFAFPFTGASVFWIIQGLVTLVLIGHLFGVKELGAWNLAMTAVTVPLSLLAAPISRVMYAGFARMRGERERIAELWLKGFTLIAAIMLPALFGLVATAPDLIPFAFGDQWLEAVPIVQILCVLIMSRSLQTWNEPVMDAAGKPHVAMFITLSVLVALPPSIWVGSRFGIEGVAVAYCCATLIFGELPSFVLTTRELSLKARTVLGRLAGILPSCVVTCLAVVVERHALKAWGVPIGARIVLSVLCGVAIYVSLLALFARQILRELLILVRPAISRLPRR